MSQALERVIEEQQAEIDRLKEFAKSDSHSWQMKNEEDEKFMRAFWSFYNAPSDMSRKKNMRDVLRDLGYCVSCQERPCECDE